MVRRDSTKNQQESPVKKLIKYYRPSYFSLVLITILSGCSTSPQFDKSEFGAKFEPPAGRALHGWGQITHGWNTNHRGAQGDIEDYDDYMATVAPHSPSVVSFYIHPQRKDGQAQLEGFVSRYTTFAKNADWQVAQIGYDFDPETTLSGKGDQQLELFFNTIETVGKPVLLRIGWEFNNRDHFNPKGYREGYRYIVNKMRTMGTTKVATLWHASPPDLNELTGMPILEDHPYMDYYPGDQYVDWWSISLFAPESFRSAGSVEFYQQAAARKKPVFIGESSPWFTEGKSMTFRNPESLTESMQWFDAYFSLFEEYPQIKGMNMIIVDWQRWNWIWPQIKGGFNNTRLDLWPQLPGKVREKLSSPRFMHSDEVKHWLKSTEQ
jgi:hypothetical protein